MNIKQNDQAIQDGIQMHQKSANSNQKQPFDNQGGNLTFPINLPKFDEHLNDCDPARRTVPRSKQVMPSDSSNTKYYEQLRYLQNGMGSMELLPESKLSGIGQSQQPNFAQETFNRNGHHPQPVKSFEDQRPQLDESKGPQINFDLTMNDSGILNITDDQTHLIPDNINEVQVRDNIFPNQNVGQSTLIHQGQSQLDNFLQNGAFMSFTDNIEQLRQQTTSQHLSQVVPKQMYNTGAQKVESMNCQDLKMASNSMGYLCSNKLSLKGSQMNMNNPVQRQHTHSTIQGSQCKFGPINNARMSLSGHILGGGAMSVGQPSQVNAQYYGNKFMKPQSYSNLSPDGEAEIGDLENPSIPLNTNDKKVQYKMARNRCKSINSFDEKLPLHIAMRPSHYAE